MWRRKHDNMFSRFDTIPACDGRTDGQTDRRTDVIADARKNDKRHCQFIRQEAIIANEFIGIIFYSTSTTVAGVKCLTVCVTVWLLIMWICLSLCPHDKTKTNNLVQGIKWYHMILGSKGQMSRSQGYIVQKGDVAGVNYALSIECPASMRIQDATDKYICLLCRRCRHGTAKSTRVSCSSPSMCGESADTDWNPRSHGSRVCSGW